MELYIPHASTSSHSTFTASYPHEAMEGTRSDLNPLEPLGSTVYAHIHEDDRVKSAKFAPRAEKGQLVGYDCSTIYRVFIHDEKKKVRKVIRTKDLKIGDNAVPKGNTELPTYDAIMEKRSTSQREHNSRGARNNTTPSNLPEAEGAVRTTKRGRGRPTKQPLQILLADVMNLCDDDQHSIIDPSGYRDDDPLILVTKMLERHNIRDPRTWVLLNTIAATNSDTKEPQNYRESRASENAEQWDAAMPEEYDTLIENEIWTIVNASQVPLNHKALDGKWVYRIKKGPNDEIIKWKARWVVKGFQQREGIDFHETFAAVIKPMTFRIIFALAAHFDLKIMQVDVKTAFLYDKIDEEIYVKLPQGFTQENKVCKLHKALYGPKQSPRVWYHTLRELFLNRLGLHHTEADHSVFIKDKGVEGPIVIAYVDDIQIMGPKGKGMEMRVFKELESDDADST